MEEFLNKVLMEKLDAAGAAMERMTHIKVAWAELVKSGYKEGAEAMRNAVYLYLVSNPDATELEVVQMLADKVGYKL